jgi:hypothetical protein
MATKKQLKLTKLQADILEALVQGEIISIDSRNMATMGERAIAPQTRYFLTEKRLVTRKDKTKAVTTSGNGYIISPKGAKVLREHKSKESGQKRKRIYSTAPKSEARRLTKNDGILVEEVTELPPDPPTDRQLEYAKDLGISIPPDATKDDLSDLISLKVDKDQPSTERHREFVKKYGIELTEFVGKKALFDRIQAALVAPGREKELLSWFTFRVYRELAKSAANAPIQGPDDQTIQEIAEELVSDEKIVKSIRRYEGRELIWFGEWTSPDGYVHTGGSNRTVAYKQVLSLLKEKAIFPEKSHKKASSAPPVRNWNKKNISESQGCLSVIVFAFLISVCIVVSVEIIMAGSLLGLAFPLCRQVNRLSWTLKPINRKCISESP